jgi:hypothetical protein
MAEGITRDELNEIIEMAELDESAVRENYSGRGMYGAECLGIAAESDDETLLFALAVGQVLGFDRAFTVLRDSRSDSMGRGTITYFPRIKIEKE